MNRMSSNHTETAGQSMARLNKPMEVRPEVRKRTGSARRRVGGFLLAATLVAGAHQLRQGGQDGQPSTPVPEATTPTSIHTVKAGETPWGIVSEAQKAGLIDNSDPRPHVDDIAGQDPHMQPGDKVVVHLDHPVDQPVDPQQ